MLSTTEQFVLGVFRQYLVTPGEMLCFHGDWFEEHEVPLRRLIERKLIIKEHFKGGYSLTKAGYAVVHTRRSPARRSKSDTRRAPLEVHSGGG